MSKIYIRRLTVSGENKTASTVDFGDGLNIVYGVSDTGKSCIFKCIDFVFGSRGESPVPKEYGYSVVKLDIRTERGEIRLERKIGGNRIQITSMDPMVPSGEYPLPEFGRVILGILGISGQPRIIKNSRYEQVHLTWRTLLHAFLITEDEISQSESVLISRESTAKTLSLSGLLYLIKAPDCSEFDPTEDKKIREARKKAVETYIADELKSLEEQHKKLLDLLNHQSMASPEQELRKLTKDLSEMQTAISKEAGRQKGILAEILSCQERLAECGLLSDRYEELRSQYGADIKRLSFIINGEELVHEVSLPERCPFCRGELQKSEEISYVKAANAELARIAKLMADLEETEKTIAEDQRRCQEKLRELERSRNESEKLLNKELKPQADQIGKSLEQYRQLVGIQKEIEMIERIRQEKTRNLEGLTTAEGAAKTEYRPKEHYPAGFEATMTKIFHQILKECRYENLVTSRFSMKDFDVWVNERPKKNFGQGHRAFLNTLLAVAMREYLREFGAYPPGLLLIDSPLLSLEQGVKDAAPESMKSALMEYLMRTQDRGQTILIENNIPDLDYIGSGVTLHHFTKGKTGGRYGLLADITE